MSRDRLVWRRRAETSRGIGGGHRSWARRTRAAPRHEVPGVPAVHIRTHALRCILVELPSGVFLTDNVDLTPVVQLRLAVLPISLVLVVLLLAQ